MTAVVVIVAVLAAASLTGWLLTRRSGTIREIDAKPDADADADIAALGLSRSDPTVVHFSAPWCGPCDRVRRVVEQVCGDLDGVAHVEIDLDANPETARRYSVLSLPTTLIFDAEGRQRYRTSGVPNAADLRSALKPLLA
ncbi:thiol reductase thioredoxin [Mycobacterium sp. 1165196.3]|uniref:thioredoxin family protein n=1 Tax=Mycobacterium sp. 1165196.3 TaxID=1834071 RepID=UPI0007FC8015|nr:thioredoxin family protein [Mycobacterium sp. 1165196.3]OBK32788.1 thiol reductase thioredoxin [Mycobacterium sp. 1165196.3]